MELEVFSDPVWGIGQRDGVDHNDLPMLATYDEEIVKPALLIADRVILRTWRLDLARGESIAAAGLRLGVPLGASIRAVVERNSQRELEYIGIDRPLFDDLSQLVQRFSMKAGGIALDPTFFESDAVGEFVRLKFEIHRRQYSALRSPALESLEVADLLSSEAWDAREESSWIGAQQNYWHTSFDYGWDHMQDALDNSDRALLIDNGIGERLVTADSSVDYPSARVLSNATDLLRIIDGLSAASIDEIVDIRSDLTAHLAPFRGFILSHASSVDIDPNLPFGERKRQLAIKWESEVAPAVDELRYKVESSRFMSGLARTTATGPEAAIGLGLGLATALASGSIGVTALAGLGVAALPTLIKATSSTLSARRESRQSGAYFLYAAERRIRNLRKT